MFYARFERRATSVTNFLKVHQGSLAQKDKRIRKIEANSTRSAG